jgi:CheY-like chemotaxis protein
MHGDVWAESRKNKGSTFHFTAWLEKSKKSPAKRIYSASLQNKKILIVDDNRTNLNILSRYLEYVGIQSYTLSNGEKISETLEDACKSSAPFDLFVLNLQMTGVEGYDMPKIINELNIPKICLLAFSSNIVKDAKRCQEAGFNGYLPKPIKRNKFLKMIKHLLCDDDSSEEKTRENKIATQHSITEDAKISVNILLAEDNPVNQKLTFTMLKKAGYNVEVANNGKEVVKKYSKEPEKFDLIFMDLQMPELDGLSASKEIRNMGFTSVPIVAMTANVMKSDRESCLEAGMNDFVDKPIKRYTVFEIIRKWVLDR